jgi:ribosomal protein S18 acetylase RimI-like enzyme
MSSSLPEGFSLRPAADDDLEAVAAVFAAEEAALRGTSSTTSDDLQTWFRIAGRSGERLVVERGGRIAAAALALSSEGANQLFLAVDPDVDRALWSALVDRAQESAKARGLEAARVDVAAEDADAAGALADRGYADVRHFFVMAIELAGFAQTAAVPEALLLDTFAPDDARAFHAALNESFAGEWGWFPLPFDEWWSLRAGDDKSIWFVARDGDELAGVIRCEPRRDGGFVGAVGVRPAWRRRGIARALLETAFAEFRRRGGRVVTLGVDAENPTGATRLYERAGMHVESERIVYEKRLR